MLLNVEPLGMKMKKMDTRTQTHTNTHTHTVHTPTVALQTYKRSTRRSMKKTLSVVFTAPVDEGETLMIVTKLFFKLNLKF